MASTSNQRIPAPEPDRERAEVKATPHPLPKPETKPSKFVIKLVSPVPY